MSQTTQPSTYREFGLAPIAEAIASPWRGVDVSDGIAATADRLGSASPWARAAGLLALLCIVISSAGCILTKDLPDPALDIPDGYKAARLTKAADALPTLDWWRGFRSTELTTLMEEAQTVNLDIAAATARFLQADAQARITGAALLPSLSGTGQETYSRNSGSSSSGLTNGGREVVNYSASLSAELPARFLGQESRCRAGRGRDRGRQPLRSRRGGADHADQRRQCLFSGADLAGPHSDRPAQYRERHAYPQRHQGAAEGRHRNRSRRRAAGGCPRQSTCICAAAAANARSEHQRAGDAGIAAAGKPCASPAAR